MRRTCCNAVSTASSKRPASRREREILELWVTGHRLDYVAESLFISKNTVKTHLRHIYQKTQTGNKEELLVLFEQQA